MPCAKTGFINSAIAIATATRRSNLELVLLMLKLVSHQQSVVSGLIVRWALWSLDSEIATDFELAYRV